MTTDAPDISQAGFASLIDRVINAIHGSPYMGGSIPCAVRDDDPIEAIRPYPRLMVQLEGTQWYSRSVGGKRIDFSLLPGQSVYWATNAWSLEPWRTQSKYFGVVMRFDCLRLIEVHIGNSPPTEWGTPWYYQTRLPMEGAGALVARALDRLAETGDPGGASRDLMISLLRLGRQHLLEDDPTQLHRRSQLTWQSVQQYLEENYARPVTRASAAASLGLHPNYLSTLARHVAGKSFRQVLETIRMNHAQRLLRSTDLKLLRIAMLCGYSDSANFNKAFRRIVGVTPGRFRVPRTQAKP